MAKLKFLLVFLVSSLSQLQCATSRSSRASNEIDSAWLGNSYSYFHFILGELETLNGNTELALEHYSLANQFDSSSAYIQLKQAEQLISLNRVVQARQILDSIRMKESADFYLLDARISALELDLDRAVKSIDLALKLFKKENDPSRFRETILMKVALLSDSRKFKEAIRTLQAYLKDESEDEIGFYFLGKIYSLMEQRSEAEKAYLKALELRPTFATAARALGLLYELSGDLERAIQVYTVAVRGAPQDLQLRQKLSNLHLATENFAGALEHLRFMVQADPEDYPLQLKTALVLFKLEHYSEAETFLKGLLNKAELSQDRVHFYLAALYEEQESFEQALQHYKRVQPDSEYFSDSRLQSVFILSDRLKKPERVPAVLLDAIALRPSVYELYLSLASFYESQQRLPDTIRILERAALSIPKNEKIIFALGTYLHKTGQFEAGIKRMRELLEVNPQHAHAMNHIGYVFADRKINLEEAEQLLVKAVQIEPQNAYIVDSLGWLYHQKGDFKKAREILERAHQLDSDEPVIIEHLADVYTKLGLHDLALGMYQRIINESPATGSAKVESSNRESKDENAEKDMAKRVRQKIAGLSSDGL